MQIDKIELDTDVIRRLMAKRGLHSFKELAQASGVHRNTVSDYLTGTTKPLPEGLERILAALGATPGEALRATKLSRAVPAASIAALVDSLNPLLTQACLILYGSRARGRPKQYSDYDLGVYHAAPIEFSRFSKMLDIVAKWNDTHTIEVQLTNLSLADREFLQAIATEGIFITGSLESWLKLLQQAEVEPCE